MNTSILTSVNRQKVTGLRMFQVLLNNSTHTIRQQDILMYVPGKCLNLLQIAIMFRYVIHGLQLHIKTQKHHVKMCNYAYIAIWRKTEVIHSHSRLQKTG